jgi:GNAT superfamily N-acetyltransferase
MSIPFHLRVAAVSDSESLSGLCGELGYSSSAGELQQRLMRVLASTNDLVLVAVREDVQVIGWIHAHGAHLVVSGFHVEILGLVVSSSARRLGVGRALVARAECWGQELGARQIVVRSNLQRIESHAFYPAIGYTEVKKQSVYRKRLVKGSDVEGRITL